MTEIEVKAGSVLYGLKEVIVLKVLMEDDVVAQLWDLL